MELVLRTIELPKEILDLLEQAEELEAGEGMLRSKVRFSSLGEQLFVHSAFPTEAPNSVFFGPDTYRFVRALCAELADIPADASFTIIDIGCGSGAGGLHAAARMNCRTHADVILADINPKALRYSRINASINGLSSVRTVLSDVFDKINEGGNLIIANPPYLVDRLSASIATAAARSDATCRSGSWRRASIACIRRPVVPLHRHAGR